MIPPEKRAAYMGDRISTFYEALETMYRDEIEPLEFDTFLVFDTHWYTTLEFIVNGHERHNGRYTSDEIPWMIDDVAYDYPGDSAMADLIAAECAQAGVPLYVAREVGLPWHYPVLNTMKYLNPKRIRRVLPMSVSYTSSIENELRFGSAIRRAVERSPRKVVLVATGGLSHRFWEMDVIRKRASASIEDIYSDVHRGFDQKIIGLLGKGDHRAVLAMAEDFRRECSPEGRFAHYIRMVGALGGESCTLRARQHGDYEAALGTGQVNLWFEIDD
jgi:3,4-dihydroxyphenylacetate 2,3-dioxygenase